jgi:hypothetical protein
MKFQTGGIALVNAGSLKDVINKKAIGAMDRKTTRRVNAYIADRFNPLSKRKLFLNMLLLLLI